jgi:hypothetical protein
VLAVVEVGQSEMSGRKAETVPAWSPSSVTTSSLDDGSEASHRLALRYYDDAQAVIKIASKVTKPQLRADRR